MTIEELKKYKRVLILGYGVTGKATEEFFKKFFPQTELIIADEKDDPNCLEKQAGVDLVVKTPSTSMKRDRVYMPCTTLTDIYLANTPLTTIGITGTKGKSTTVSLLKNVFDKAGINNFVLGNIGAWDLEALTTSEPGFAIFELSSYQLDDVVCSAHIGVFLNIYKEHHTHDSYADYLLAKANITKYQSAKDYFIYNPLFKELTEIASKTVAKSMPIDIKKKVEIQNSSLKGNHNKLNIQAVITICKLLSIQDKYVTAGISSFEGLPHRLQFVGKFADIDFYNDSASNNPAATVGAIDALGRVDTLIMGGQNRDFDFGHAVDTIIEHKVKTLILFPNTDGEIVKLLQGNRHNELIIHHAESMQDAVKFAFENTPIGGVCLLSPGAPSYLMYANFPARGEDFVKQIHEKEKENT